MVTSDGIEKDGDIRRANLYFEGDRRLFFSSPRRQGPSAATQTESDLQVLRQANTALATLQTVAASEMPAERNERLFVCAVRHRPWRNERGCTTRPTCSEASQD